MGNPESAPAPIWSFPLRGRGLAVLAGGIALVALATLLASVEVPLVPAAVVTVIAIYLCSFSYLIVRDTSRGADQVVSWPGLPTREAFYVPVARFVAGALWGCLPAFLYRILTGYSDILFWLLFLLGVYLLPMVLVRVATRESFLAGHPVATLISILRTLRDYTTTCVPYYLAVLIVTLSATAFTRERLWWLVGLADVLALYLSLSVLYALGLFHRRVAHRLHLRSILDSPPEEPAPAETDEIRTPLPPDVPAPADDDPTAPSI